MKTHREDADTLTVWTDNALLLLCGFILIVMLLNRIEESKKTEGSESPGDVVVQILWQDKLDADVDLWVKAPGDVPVGYSNKAGKIFNLLRDDLGKTQDVTDYNSEIAYTRGSRAGEYVVNIHMYRNPTASFPLPVRVIVSSRRAGTKSPMQLFTTTVELHKNNEELTALRFTLNDKGEPVGKPNTVYKGLRVAQ